MLSINNVKLFVILICDIRYLNFNLRLFQDRQIIGEQFAWTGNYKIHKKYNYI